MMMKLIEMNLMNLFFLLIVILSLFIGNDIESMSISSNSDFGSNFLTNNCSNSFDHTDLENLADLKEKGVNNVTDNVFDDLKEYDFGETTINPEIVQSVVELVTAPLNDFDNENSLETETVFEAEKVLNRNEILICELKNQSLFKPSVILIEDGSLTLNDLLSLSEVEVSEILVGAISVSESTAKFVSKKFFSLLNKF